MQQRRRFLIGSTMVLLGMANPLAAQQPPGFQAPGIIPGRPYKVEPVPGVGAVPGVAPVQGINGMPGLEEPKLSLMDRTRVLLHKIGLLKNAPESPIQTAPGTITRAPRSGLKP